MSANIEGMVREGINAFKAGRKDEARALLSKAVELDPYHEDGWLWLSGVVTSAEDQRTCLENVLAINPANARARSGLDYLIRQSGGAPSEPPPPTPPPTPAKSTPPASLPPASASPPPAPAPSSVEWDSSASEAQAAGWHAAQTAATDNYDEWVAGLQLRDTAPVPSPRLDPYAPIAPSSPFSDESGLADDEATADDEFAEAAIHASMDAYSARQTAAMPGAPLIYQIPPLDDEDDEEDLIEASAAPPASLPPRMAEPVNLADVPLDEDEAELIEDEDRLFPEIPREIKATRLPGSHERGPFLLKLAAVVLVPLNLAAAILLLWKLL